MLRAYLTVPMAYTCVGLHTQECMPVCPGELTDTPAHGGWLQGSFPPESPFLEELVRWAAGNVL